MSGACTTEIASFDEFASLLAASNAEPLSLTVGNAARAADEASRLAQAASQAASQGCTVVGQFLVAMQSISAGSHKIADSGMIRSTASGAKHESARMPQLSEAIAEIDRMTLQNAARVEQSAAAAQSMNQQAEQMSTLAGEFRLQRG
ncbi:hypothetical protein [Paucibacter sp. M5-1]|uniref:hypothetical protein n=1 Tax=Paucibacter sp. M5-1 TaxID=3015998 RepID=UPI0022B8FF97|nr:hypothetical protein [Paucibacter sp. M5-1]MCZ7880477.1 hypothetical protein [Paucibacter sp. M5-1]